jgi:phage FluMu protein Com
MPIRFRCAYCNQLMGIARRKAGTVVRCPKCAGEVIVPSTREAPQGPSALNQMLEDDEFAKELASVGPAAEQSPNPLLPPPAYLHSSLPEAEPDAVGEPATRNLRRSGLFLPAHVLILLVAGLVAALGITLSLGVILGRWTAP